MRGVAVETSKSRAQKRNLQDTKKVRCEQDTQNTLDCSGLRIESDSREKMQLQQEVNWDEM